MKQIAIADGIKAYYGIAPDFIVVEDGSSADLVRERSMPVVFALLEELMAAAEE